MNFLKRIGLMAIATIFFVAPVGIADDNSVATYAIIGQDLHGFGIGVSGVEIAGLNTYMGIEADRNKSPIGDAEIENTMALALGLNGEVSDSVDITLYGTAGFSFEQSCPEYGAAGCDGVDYAKSAWGDVRGDAKFNPGIGVRMNYQLTDVIGVSFGARVTERSDTAFTVGVNW